MEHHVYFWLKDECQSAADRAVFEQALASLFDIEQVGGGRWALPAAVMPRPVIDQSWDYALTMQFANVAAHDAYQVHPQHEAFLGTFMSWWAQVQVRDLA